MKDNSNPNWRQMNLLHLVYPRDDPIAKALAYSSTAPLIISVALATLVCARRDLHTIFLFIGVLFDETINGIVKRILKYPRPDAPYENKLTTYGMPSSHAQFMGFFCTYSILFLLVRLPRNAIKRKWRYLLCATCVAMCWATCYSRVYLRYHTSEQVYVGLTLGACIGFLWFFVVHHILTPYFPRICDSYFGRLFMLQDFTHIPNVLSFEYTNSRNWCRRNTHEE